MAHDWTMALVGTLILLMSGLGCAASMAASPKPDQGRHDQVPTVHATRPFVPYAESDRASYQFVGTTEEIELYLSIWTGSGGEGWPLEQVMALVNRIEYGEQLCTEHGLTYSGFYAGTYGQPRTTPVCHGPEEAPWPVR